MNRYVAMLVLLRRPRLSMKICVGIIFFVLFCIFPFVVSSQNVTPTPPLIMLSCMKWEAFKQTSAYHQLAPVKVTELREELLCSDRDNLCAESTAASEAIALYTTKKPWLALLVTEENPKSRYISSLLLFCSKLTHETDDSDSGAWRLPFSSYLLKSKYNISDLFDRCFRKGWFPDRRSVVEYYWFRSQVFEFITCPNRSPEIDIIKISGKFKEIDDWNDALHRRTTFSDFDEDPPLRRTRFEKLTDEQMKKLDKTSGRNPTIFINAQIVQGKISLDDALIDISLGQRVIVNEYSNDNLITNSLAFSEYKVTDYLSVCSVKDLIARTNHSERIHQVCIRINPYLQSDSPEYIIPNVESYFTDPFGIKWNATTNLLIASACPMWEWNQVVVGMDEQTGTTIWCSYSDGSEAPPDPRDTYLKLSEIKFSKDTDWLRRYSRLFYNPLFSKYNLFDFW